MNESGGVLVVRLVVWCVGSSVVCFIASKAVVVGLLCIVTRLVAKAIFEEVGAEGWGRAGAFWSY